jgi:hypothetical protein
MNELMHPEDLLDYAREHHEYLLQLVESERMLARQSSDRLSLRERILMGMKDLLITLRLRASSTEGEVGSRSSCDKAGVCIV